MYKKMKRACVAAAAALLCLGLSGCELMGGQNVKNAKEAADTFLTSIQSKDFTRAVQFMEPGNNLIHVFAALDGESIPELDPVYRTFAEQMGEMTFENLGEVKELPNTYLIRITNRDYASSISAAMEEALKSQVETGGDDFENFAGWLGAGVENAAAGAAAEYNLMLTQRKGGYYLQHEGVSDLEFLNLLTGGFYDYTGLTMTTCTGPDGDQKTEYCIAALGDEVIALLQADTIPYDTASLTEEDISQLKSMYAAASALSEGIWESVEVGNGTITVRTGINFIMADQNALSNAGIVSGKYKGNTSFSYLSLRETVEGFTEEGMTCVTVPEYGKEK